MAPLNARKLPSKAANLNAAENKRTLHLLILGLVLVFAAQLAITQNMPVGKNDFIQAPDKVAGFCRKDVNGDDVSRLYRVLVPPKEANRRRAALFAGPMLDVALVILDVEKQNAVRISPMEFRDRGVLQDQDFVLVSRGSVMRERGGAGHSYADNKSKKHQPLTSHLAPREPVFAF